MKEIKRFVTDRQLDKMEFCYNDFVANVIEELLEIKGYDIPKEKRPELKFAAKKALIRITDDLGIIPKYGDVGLHNTVDAITDVRVFCIDATMKMGYDPECTLKEVGKEINSREGEIIDGKFQKYTTPEAKAKWYKASFVDCRADSES